MSTCHENVFVAISFIPLTLLNSNHALQVVWDAKSE